MGGLIGVGITLIISLLHELHVYLWRSKQIFEPIVAFFGLNLYYYFMIPLRFVQKIFYGYNIPSDSIFTAVYRPTIFGFVLLFIFYFLVGAFVFWILGKINAFLKIKR